MFNLVVLTGRICQDLELKTTQSGISVTSFAIAVQRLYKSGEEPKTDFINIVAWRGTAEFVTKYFKKGQMIGIEGSIQTRKYQDRDGNNRTAFEIMAQNVQFVEFKSQGDNSPSGEQRNSQSQNNASNGEDPLKQVANRLSEFQDMGELSDDDLPF